MLKNTLLNNTLNVSHLNISGAFLLQKQVKVYSSKLYFSRIQYTRFVKIPIQCIILPEGKNRNYIHIQGFSILFLSKKILTYKD